MSELWRFLRRWWAKILHKPIIVAAHDASEIDKRKAHYVCNTYADDEVLQRAIDFSSGRICPLGTFHLRDGAVLRGKHQFGIGKFKRRK